MAHALPCGTILLVSAPDYTPPTPHRPPSPQRRLASLALAVVALSALCLVAVLYLNSINHSVSTVRLLDAKHYAADITKSIDTLAIYAATSSGATSTSLSDVTTAINQSDSFISKATSVVSLRGTKLTLSIKTPYHITICTQTNLSLKATAPTGPVVHFC